MGGRGGAATGGAGGVGTSSYSNGGSGATAQSGSLTVGGGGGGSGWDGVGKAGGMGVGGIYNAATGTIAVIGTSAITNNVGAGGGGGGGSGTGSNNENGGSGGLGVGGVYNLGTFKITTANYGLMSNNVGVSGSGGLEGGTGTTGTVPTAVTHVGGTGTTDLAYVPPPTITSATYDAASGALSVTGTNLTAGDIIALNKITISGEGGLSRVLTSGTTTATNATTFNVTLNAADRAAINQFINKDGTTSTGGTAFNLAAADDWNTNVTAGNTADATNAITASNVAVPAVTSATYDAATGTLVVTGTNFVRLNGANNDIDLTMLTLAGEGGASRTLTTTNVEITDGTSFTVVLNAADKAAFNLIANKDGTVSTSGTTFNLAAASNWAAGAAPGGADLLNGVTVSNVAAPTITSATYNASTGSLVVTGTGFLKFNGANNDIDTSKLSFVGEGGVSHGLTSSSVEVTDGTTFTVALNAADKQAINQIANKSGTSSTGAITYNLAAAEDWARGADPAVVIADTLGNGITVSNVAVPTITNVTYDASNGTLVVTGTGFLKLNGATNDVDVSKLTITGQGGAPYPLTTSSVEITSDTQFTIVLSGTDQAGLRTLVNANGTQSSGGTTYNLAANEDWAAGADAAVVVADLTGNGITVSNVVSPTLTSATYDAATGTLLVTATGMLTGDAIDATKLTLTGQGGSFALTADTANTTATSATAFTLTLGAADKLAVNGILNNNGTAAAHATVFNLAGATGWNSTVNAPADTTGNGITVSNVVAPTITSATYDGATGTLVVTGTGLVKTVGATNDITVNTLTITGEGGSYGLSTTADVEVTSATSFTLTLSGADIAAVNALLNKNGTSSAGNATYNIAAADDWNSAITGASIADLTGNAITVSNAAPGIQSASYNASTGVLTVAALNIVAGDGIDV
ncbi:beta strand repeat-containing protein, partial [Acidovorax sp.]|uniref:beta strand repeat-containing protein n=1 Tax=Acidovorax sp. TaxID=1872122 RepID=UPI00391F36E7